MINLTLKRILSTPNSTAGILLHDSYVIGFVIEDGHRDTKEYGLTRIPPGTYQVKRRNYGRFYDKYHYRWGHEWVAELVDVPGFEAILIHIGNTPENTKGCLLLNDSIHLNREVQEWHGTESTYCYKRFYNYMDKIDEPVQITIV